MSDSEKIRRLVDVQPVVRRGGETYKITTQPRPKPPPASTPPPKPENNPKQ